MRGGLGWGDAKQRVVQLIEAHVGPMRERYADLVAHPEHIEDVLQAGAAKARATATPFINELRHAVGLRRMLAVPQPKAARAQAAKSDVPVFKQYREADGQFYFKLTAADGSLLLQSQAFAQGRDAGEWVKRFKQDGAQALNDAPVAIAEGVSRAIVEAALAALVAAQEAASS